MKNQFYILSIIIAQLSFAQTTFSNGNISTGSTTKNGVNAPSGYTWSELQNNTGNTSQANTLFGSACFNTGSSNFFVADDFIIPPNQTWNITAIDFFAYQTGYSGTTSPINTVRVKILNGNPNSSTSTSVFGDNTTNRYASSEDSKIYRVDNTQVPFQTTPGQSRKIWKIKANVPKTLTSGTYWIQYQFENIVKSNGGFCPPVTVIGSRSLPSFNAVQLNANNSWTNIYDEGNPISAQDVPVAMPFVITYTTSTLGTNEVLQYDNRIQAYPNPAKESFMLNIPNEVLIKNIEIYDASGKLIKTMQKSDAYKINDLKSGIYTIKVNTNEIPKVTRLIVK